MTNFDYIVVQAGGLGSRMKQYTRNKPKAIVSVLGLPMIFHLFRKYPDKKFIVIADYKAEVLHKYLEAFADVECFVVEAEGKGTCAGIASAMNVIPSDEAFMLVWSDLILGSDTLNDIGPVKQNYLGISKEFPCRWSYVNGCFVEEPSSEHGVAGLFIFKSKAEISDVPKEGEFVRYLSTKDIDFVEASLCGTREVGTLLAYNQTSGKERKYNCRPFNTIKEENGHLKKLPVDKQGEEIAKSEIGWYKHVTSLCYSSIPQIYNYQPLEMEKIDGYNLYDIQGSDEKKRLIIDKLVSSLENLHSLGSATRNIYDLQSVYFTKTYSRLATVRDLIPFADKEKIKINGRLCHNPYFYKTEVRKLIENTLFDCNFTLVHGDCTFSNVMLSNEDKIVFIDPRGYFGKTKIYGDEAYDWAKLYYSIAGDYDKFNQKKFSLLIDQSEVQLDIESNGWHGVAEYYLEKIRNHADKKKIRLLHSLIWLSLSTYAWDDYDSICGAFYNGTYYLEEFL